MHHWAKFEESFCRRNWFLCEFAQSWLICLENQMKVNIEENLLQSDRSIEVAAKRWRASINQSIVNHSPALLFPPAIDTLLTQNELKYNHKCRLKMLLCESWIAITWMLQVWFICIYSKEINSFFFCKDPREKFIVNCGSASLKTGDQAVRMKKINLNLGTNSLLWIKEPRENIKPRIAKRNVWCEGKRSSIQIYSAISQRRLGQTISC